MDILSRNFENNNIRFIVDYKEDTKLNQALRLIEVFNDHLENNKEQVRPIGFRINNFGTNNPLHTSESYIEAAIDIIRSLDKHTYLTTEPLTIGECKHIKFSIKEKAIRMTHIKNILSSEGIEYKPLANDRPILTSLIPETEFEIVFSNLKDMPSHRESAQLCSKKGNGEYFICNVANVGSLNYSVKGNNTIEVDADIYVDKPKDLYKDIINSINEQFNKF